MTNFPDIKNQLSSKGLFDAFKVQLAKDFEQSEFSFDFIEALEPDYLTIQAKIVSVLLRDNVNSNSHLMRLLNRIDISEAQLKKYLTSIKNEDRLAVIAGLIIKRVLQKVVIKLHYKRSAESS